MCFFLDGNFVNRFFIVVFINKDASKDDIITESLFSRGGSGISQGFRENPGFPVFRVIDIFHYRTMFVQNLQNDRDIQYKKCIKFQ